MAAKKKAPKEPVKAVPVSHEGDGYGEDANKIKFADENHQASKRFGYFARQLDMLRDEVFELEEKVSKAAKTPAEKKAIEILKAEAEREAERYDLVVKELDEKDKLLDRACELMHAAGIPCIDYDKLKECATCEEKFEPEAATADLP